MIRVVVDTNVFVSSFFGGKPRQIIDRWKTGQILLCLSRPIVDEYVNVLSRMGLQNKDELKALLNIFARGFNCLFTAETPKLHVVKADPADNKFIECAVALDASYVISGDKALLAVQSYMDIEILSPADFLTRFEPS